MRREESRTFRPHSVIITHIFWSISVNRGDKAFRMVAFVHKLCPVIPLHKRPQKDMGNDDSHSKGGGGVERGGDPCGRPDNAPHFWRPFSHVQVFSHCAEQRCLPSSALAIRSLCGFAERWGMVRRSPWGVNAPLGLGDS